MFHITPEYLTNYINFNYGQNDWFYSQNVPGSIAKIQTEGTAKLWNLLLDKSIALLSDEVGMGKTYQALGVMLTLWLQKPNAKILLYAPNENVALKWVNEYNNFIRYHYRDSDDKIKSSINGVPLRQAIYCESHLQLMKALQSGWPSLYICKTSSLSNLLSKKLTQEEIEGLNINIIKKVDEKSSDEEKSSWMYRFAMKCNEKTFKWLGAENKSPFDLLIFDEAHYLRRANGDSNRSIVANAFFSGRDICGFDKDIRPLKPIAEKVLLLTATPNHTSSGNVENIVSLFNQNFKGKNALDILNEVCVRRFRRLEGKTKHEYRKEIDEPVAIDDIKEKIFFATYQRALVRHKAELNRKNKSNVNKHNPYRILFGYLEGFEFLPNKQEQGKKLQDSSISGDYVEREDGHVIQELSDKYKKAYGHYPLHPKYVKTVEQLQPKDAFSLQPDKKVVFVRRIPSVFEISRRLMEKYDDFYFEILLKSNAFDDLKNIKNLSEKKVRKYFSDIAKANALDNSEGHDNLESKVPTDEYNKQSDFHNVNSRVLDLFTIKKDDQNRAINTTDCSNFRNRFLKREQIFSVFFEPAMDYKKAAYHVDIIYYFGEKRQYRDTVKYQRYQLLNENEQFQILGRLNLETGLNGKKSDALKFDTLLSLFFKLKCGPELSKRVEQTELIYDNFSLIEKEGFARYLEKGILFSSGFIVIFYATMKSISHKKNYRGEELYERFCNAIASGMEQNGLADLICKAINTFRIFYRKELGKTEENLLSENWNFLANTLPVYAVCAETNRNSILKAFNTPFYPNTLVSTSVLQEGVDLHYHCNEIIHYGIAWTQGDNEQRVGRVDRLNGKMELQLKTNPKSDLLIHYPYLKNTIDEDQTSRFILRKFEAEKLIDQFKNVELSSEINYAERVPAEVWKKCFNNPEILRDSIIDPFPVVYEDFKNITTPTFQNTSTIRLIELLNPIFNTLALHFKDEFKVFKNEENALDTKSFAIKHVRQNGRHQPLIAEFDYYERGMNILQKPVYLLRIKTPIYRRGYHYDNLTNFGKYKNIYAENPIIKICYDDKKRDEFKYFVCIDLPLFYTSKNETNLSQAEFIHLIEELISFSDELEKQYTGNADIKNEAIIGNDLLGWSPKATILGHNRMNEREIKWKANEHYIFREKGISEKMEMLQLYTKNRENYFVKYCRNNQQNFASVGIYKNDALEEEMTMLDNIFQGIF